MLFSSSVGGRAPALGADNKESTVFNFHQNQEAVRGESTIRQYRVLVRIVLPACLPVVRYTPILPHGTCVSRGPCCELSVAQLRGVLFVL